MKLVCSFLALPKFRIDVADMMRSEGRAEHEIAKTLGISGITRLSVEKERQLTSFALDAVRAVQQHAETELRDITGIIVVSQTYDQRIPAVSTRIKELINASPSAFCIDVMDGCSGFIKAVALAAMMEASAAQRILIVAGDLNSSITHQSELGTKILFGDGLGICVLETGGLSTDWIINNEGDTKSVISCSTSLGPLEMNGFEVFRFTRSKVTSMVSSFLKSKGLQKDDFDLVGLHQASRIVVETMVNNLGFSTRDLPSFTAGDYGNIGAGSIPGWLTGIDSDKTLRPRRMLAVGFGAGLSWGLATLTVEMRAGGQLDV